MLWNGFAIILVATSISKKSNTYTLGLLRRFIFHAMDLVMATTCDDDVSDNNPKKATHDDFIFSMKNGKQKKWKYTNELNIFSSFGACYSTYRSVSLKFSTINNSHFSFTPHRLVRAVFQQTKNWLFSFLSLLLLLVCVFFFINTEYKKLRWSVDGFQVFFFRFSCSWLISIHVWHS